MNPAGFAAALAEVPSIEPEFTVRAPPLAEILRRWNELFPLLRRATVRTQGCYEPEDVLIQVCQGRCTLLFIERGQLQVVAVTELRDYPRRRVLDVSFIGGRPGNDTGISEWAPHFTAHLEKMARALGATMLSGVGRIGWSKAGGFRIAGGYMTRLVPHE